MRNLTLLLFFVVLATTKTVAGNEPAFKHHTFELTIAAGLDHEFLVRRYTDPVLGQILKASERPFVGFCFGLDYIYRPIKIFGISTGFETLEYGNKQWETEVYNGSGSYAVTSVSKGYGFEGYIGVPFYLHFYQRIAKVELELITGPEFFFNVYTIENYQITSIDLQEITSINDTRYFNSTEIKQSASFAWTAQLMANLAASKALIVSIGPEWKYLELRQFSYPQDYSVPRVVPFFLGVKVGFRLGSDFYKYPDKVMRTLQGR